MPHLQRRAEICSSGRALNALPLAPELAQRRRCDARLARRGFLALGKAPMQKSRPPRGRPRTRVGRVDARCCEHGSFVDVWGVDRVRSSLSDSCFIFSLDLLCTRVIFESDQSRFQQEMAIVGLRPHCRTSALAPTGALESFALMREIVFFYLHSRKRAIIRACPHSCARVCACVRPHVRMSFYCFCFCSAAGAPSDAVIFRAQADARARTRLLRSTRAL